MCSGVHCKNGQIFGASTVARQKQGRNIHGMPDRHWKLDIYRAYAQKLDRNRDGTSAGRWADTKREA
jgi:hypothetical protein